MVVVCHESGSAFNLCVNTKVVCMHFCVEMRAVFKCEVHRAALGKIRFIYQILIARSMPLPPGVLLELFATAKVVSRLAVVW